MKRRVTRFMILCLAAAVSVSIIGAREPTRRALAAKRVPFVVRDKQAGIHDLEVTGQEQADTAVEPSIAVNPKDPKNAVIGYQAGRVDAGCAQTLGYATTFDGGKTWTHGPLPKLTEVNGGEYPLASDPVVAFGPDNTVYYNSLLCDGEFNDLGFSVSKDGGKTWSDPILVPSPLPLDDKNWIIVDNSTEPGHHTGRVYMVWDNVAPVVAMYSDDQAQTWNGPYTIYDGQGIGAMPMVMPNGDLSVVFATTADPAPPVPSDPGSEPETAVDAGKFVISVAAGAGTVPSGGPLGFSPPVTVASYQGQDVRQQRAAEDLPAAAVDPKTGVLYVSWGDNRFRKDDVNDIVFTKSEDAGVTWSPPVRLSRGKKDDWIEHFTPAMEVGQNGIVHVAYRTQKQAASTSKFSPYVKTYYRESKDGGKTWTRPLRVNRKVKTDVRFAAYSRQSAFLGDYNQLAVTGSWTYIVRCEAFALSSDEPAQFPPAVHHQRAWVAVVDSDKNGRP